MKASARSAASYEDTPGRSIVALQKLSLKHDQDIRERAGAPTDFWLAPKSRAGSAVHARASGFRGSSCSTHTSADDMALVAARQENSDRVPWSVQGEGGALSGRNPAAQRKAKVTMTFNALGVLKNEEGSAAIQEERLEVRDVRRAIAQTLKVKGAETGVGAGPKTELAKSVEKQLRDLQSAQQQ